MSLETLVTELTETGLDSLNTTKLQELKCYCQQQQSSSTDGHSPVFSAFQALLRALSKEHAQIRLSSLQAINELFVRSHEFRQLVVGELPCIMGLVFGAYQRPLPRPSEHAALLKQLGCECMYLWTEKYGAAYQRLVLGFRYLRYTVGVDFKAAARAVKRNDPVQRERMRVGRLENRREYMERVLLAVRMELMSMRPAIEEALWTLNGCFTILIPDIADLFGDPYSSSRRAEEDWDADDVDEIMAVMAVNRHAVDVDVNPERVIETEENVNNAAVYDVMRDYLRLCVLRYEPRLAAWMDRLGRLDNMDVDGLLESVRGMQRRVVDVVSKCTDLGVGVGVLHKSDDDDEGDEFETVPADYHDKVRATRRKVHNGKRQDSEEPLAFKRHPVFSLLGEPGLESDPTYVRPGVLRMAAPTTAGRLIETSSNAVEDELRLTAPVVEYGPDLLYWGKSAVDANTSGLEISHRFLGSAREEATVSGAALDNLRTRVVYYSDDVAAGRQQQQSPEVIRACRAPLNKSGRLCPRRDRIKCPLHGPIIDRDDNGQPQGGFIVEERDVDTEAAESSTAAARLSTVATAETIADVEWRDVEVLINQQQQRQQQQQQRSKRQKREEPAPKSALVDIRKSKSTKKNRLLETMLRKKPR
ncbi:hypothetical protein GGI21_000743 [Coemansia aciculifera]|nr:hypothetical protein GGI21_000743 [Coemansia aciculifera]